MDMEKTTYTTAGSVCGSCGHAHRSIAAACRCLTRHRSACRKQGGYSDRRVVINKTNVYGDYAPLDEAETAEKDNFLFQNNG